MNGTFSDGLMGNVVVVLYFGTTGLLNQVLTINLEIFNFIYISVVKFKSIFFQDSIIINAYIYALKYFELPLALRDEYNIKLSRSSKTYKCGVLTEYYIHKMSMGSVYLFDYNR